MRHLLAGAAVVLVLLNASCANDRQGMERGEFRYGASKPPPMDPTRKVVEQDCSQPLVSSSGNLLCR